MRRGGEGKGGKACFDDSRALKVTGLGVLNKNWKVEGGGVRPVE